MWVSRRILRRITQSASRKASLRLGVSVLCVACVLVSTHSIAQTSKAPVPASKAQANLPQKQEREFRKHFDDARALQSQGDQVRAELEYKAFLVEALRRSANLHARQAEHETSERLFESALQIAPENVDVLADFAAMRLAQSKIVEAQTLAERAVQSAPKNPRGQFLLGTALYLQGDYPAAKEHLEAAVVGARNFESGYLLGITYLKLKEPSRAELLFREMVTGLGDTAQIHMYLGRAYRDGGFVERAVEELRKAVAKDPNSPQVHYFLGLALLGRDGGAGFAEAVPQFQAELKKNPNDYRSRYLLGYIRLKQHELQEAESQLLDAVRLDPNNPDPLIYLGELYSETSRSEPAVEVLRKAIELTKDESRNDYQISRAHYLLGRLLLGSGKKEEGQNEIRHSQDLKNKAIQLARKRNSGDAPNLAGDELPARPPEPVATASPEEKKQADAYIETLTPAIADSYNNLGVIAAGNKNFVAAVEYFKRAREWLPSLETLDRNLGMASFYANQFEGATEALTPHLRNHPEDTRARIALVLSFFGLQKYADVREAIEPIRSQVDTEPGLSYAYAVSLVKTGDYAQGIERLKVLETADPNAADIPLLLGETFAEQSDWAAALIEYRKAMVLNPKDGRTHYLAGVALIRQGSPADAVQELRTALQLDPSNASSKYHLAFALIQLEKKDEALDLLKDALRQDPNYADAYYQLGKLQLERGETKGAISSLEAGTKSNPDSDYIHYQLALAYRRDSRTEDAEREMKVYQQLKNLHRGRNAQQSN